ncbi:hypothetical protein TGDOM2_398920 [Toxoplasma gondii GAB2-2007-GAL-DOM2]|uniref:Transmembrane protein n=1 Tax=Toxoplasma gondii GAB2-2007-GAL-DOM2 TaxID=1130820 RepID=A0A086KCB7_TOXGO|nr:hypothetical protein TGDOM2_398920 [Toxoplasma gondii GAB2-2007-GAL-DOM2]
MAVRIVVAGAALLTVTCSLEQGIHNPPTLGWNSVVWDLFRHYFATMEIRASGIPSFTRHLVMRVLKKEHDRRNQHIRKPCTVPGPTRVIPAASPNAADPPRDGRGALRRKRLNRGNLESPVQLLFLAWARSHMASLRLHN